MSPQPMIGSKGRTVGPPVDTGIDTSAQNITTAGVTLTLDFNARTNVHRIMVEKTDGGAAKFSVEILDKIISPVTLNVVYKRIDIPTLLDDNDNPFDFLNQEGQGADEIYVRIIPDADTDNDFSVRVIGAILPFKK